ncbi:MAG: phosphoribosylformylglycinamidine cyclo-ligase [Deltaproteobacteria bacterium]|nr:phosphoribosylformylglycinamidine cyclo-ligase [Deltaproteobacteria bacterium]
MSITYKDAGVDADAGDRAAEVYKRIARRTLRPEVLAGIGGFASLCRVPAGYREPVLVSGTDGVGTKLEVAFAAGRHDTVGIDLVAMCVNDVIVCGAEPLFFLDYFATGKLDEGVAAEVVSGIARGCELAGCALVGGETAEMPGFYAPGEYDLAGFAVGVVERAEIVDGTRICPGDVVLGLASSGLHSNGYSLARRILTAASDHAVLLTPTRIYAKAILALHRARILKGAAHITGGGLPGNIPRVLPKGIGAAIDTRTWTRPAVFERIAKEGPVDEAEMQRTFNLGIGMAVITAESDARAACALLEGAGERVFEVGRVVEDLTSEVRFW